MKTRYLLAAAALTGLVTGCATPKQQACKAGTNTTCCTAKKGSSCSAKGGCGGSSGCGAQKKSSN